MWILDCLQVPDWCALCFRHTQTFYKVFWLSHFPTSYFGGNFVTHYFGHSDDDPIGMCSRFQNNISHEENGQVLPLQGTFLE
jgi:hypothetical protein